MPSYIPLSRGLRALVDDDVYEALRGLRWYAARNGRSRHVYVRCARRDPATGRRLLLHHAVAALGGVRGTGPVIDHISGDTLDNQRCNLRRCSAKQNSTACRRSLHRLYQTPYLGVTRDRHSRAVAQISWRKRTLRIGTFACDVEAAIARDRVARYLRGEFAVLNFSTDDGRRLLTQVNPSRSCGARRRLPFNLPAVIAGRMPIRSRRRRSK